MKNNYEINFFEKYKNNILKRMIYGIFMGFSDSVPGYSGGTTLNLLDFYDVLILRLKLIFKRNKFQNWLKNILWLMPFVIFWIGSIFAFSYLTKWIASNNFDLALIFLFFSFSLFCCPLFYFEQKQKNKDVLFFGKNNDLKNNSLNFFYVLIGFLIFTVIAVVVYLNGGISLKDNIDTTVTIVDKSKWFLLTLTSFFAAFVMLIPGVSGQLIFYLTNLYKDFSWVILHNPFQNIPIIAIMVLCGSVGMIASIFLINFLTRKFLKQFSLISIGLVFASPLAILLGMLGNQVYVFEINNLLNNSALLICIVAFIILGLLINIALYCNIFITSFLSIYSLNKDKILVVFLNVKALKKDENKLKRIIILLICKIKKINVVFYDKELHLLNDLNKNILLCLKNNKIKKYKFLDDKLYCC